MSSSQGAALKAALFAALPGVTALDGVQVTYGEPVTYVANDMLAILSSEGTAVPATIGSPRSREETIIQSFVAGSYNGDANELQTVTERAFALMDAVVEWCRTTDPTVGGTVRSLLPDSAWELEELIGEKGCIARLTFALTFNARI
jgi:hypothetical protein